MKILVITSLCLSSALVTCGCLHYRSVAAVDVKDIGVPISTRFRYCLLLAHDKEKSGEGERLRTRMKRHQPAVFADDGIPIIIAERDESHEDWGCWKINRYQDPMGFAAKRVLYACSFSAIPLFNGTESVAREEMSLANERHPAIKFRIYRRQDNVFSFLTPLPFLLYGGIPDMRGCDSGVVRVKRESLFTGSEVKFAHEHPEGDEVLAYAFAVKLKELEDAGGITESRLQESARMMLYRKDSIAQEVAGKTSVSKLRPEAKLLSHQKSQYRIDSLVRESNSDFAYAFTLEMNGEPSIEAFFGIQGVFAREVLDVYMAEYPNADVSTLRVYVLPRLSHGRIEGRAKVLTIKPLSLSYDAATRRGKLSVRFNDGQMESARAWIRKNVETLARDKNIALVTGEIPPAAKFYLGREELKDGNVLEIEFKTE